MYKEIHINILNRTFSCFLICKVSSITKNYSNPYSLPYIPVFSHLYGVFKMLKSIQNPFFNRIFPCFLIYMVVFKYYNGCTTHFHNRVTLALIQIFVLFSTYARLAGEQLSVLQELQQGKKGQPQARLLNNYRPTQRLYHRTLRTNIDFTRNDCSGRNVSPTRYTGQSSLS